MNIDSITSGIWAFIEALLSPASLGYNSFKIEGPVIFVFPAALTIITLSIASMVWLYNDATKRKKHGLVAVIFVLLTGWPASFIWWFWLRPPTKQTP
ncbi:MAG: hypothetical protein ACOYM3_32765 [Terrimicrobiaceae bacterium]